MILKIAISPCPNDTFIFEKIYLKQLQIEGVEFQFDFMDIEELNKCARNATHDIIKISYAQYFGVEENYQLLHSGGAMGFGVGPLLVQKKGNQLDAINAKVAIPGKHTTANFLLTYLFPELKNKEELIFHDIEKAVAESKYDAGLIIHESRFTYEEKGLEKVADLGDLWQQKTNLPIPLGGIVMHKKHNAQLIAHVEELISDSIPDLNTEIILTPFIRENAQEMSEHVMAQHIQLYVNEFSKQIGKEGYAAIQIMKSVLQHSH
jgi:1,4-dihydroxy-6-naphthoate synthase